MKILFIGFFLAYSQISIGQDGTKKPTKEETLTWLGIKFKKYLITTNGRRTFVSFSGGVFIYSSKSSSGNNLIKLDFNAITKVESSNDCGSSCGGAITIYGKNVYKLGNQWLDDFSTCIDTDSDKSEDWCVVDFSLEDDLENRMIKAFKTLIEYNSPAETF